MQLVCIATYRHQLQLMCNITQTAETVSHNELVSDDDAWGKHSSNGHRINVPLIFKGSFVYTTPSKSIVNCQDIPSSIVNNAEAKPFSWSLKSGHKGTPPSFLFLFIWLSSIRRKSKHKGSAIVFAFLKSTLTLQVWFQSCAKSLWSPGRRKSQQENKS